MDQSGGSIITMDQSGASILLTRPGPGSASCHHAEAVTVKLSPSSSQASTIMTNLYIYIYIECIESVYNLYGHLVQLGQFSVSPPRLVLEVGGTSTLQAAMPLKLKSPHFKVPSGGDFSSSGMAAC